MKTKFFKKLSFVLAVAMVLSVFAPAAGAFAAKAPKLNATKKYLHLDVEGKNKYDFNISNKQKGWKYYWESSNEDVAEVNEKNGLVTATGVGTAKITVTIEDKNGEEVDTLKATVVVRDNIKTVKITNLPEDNKVAVGKEHDFNRSFVTNSGSTKKTSAITRWTVEPADKATINDSGVFKADEAGKYTITARSFQSKEKYTTWLANPEANKDLVLAEDSVEITVEASIVDIKQVNKTTFTVEFDSSMKDTDLSATTAVVYQVINGKLYNTGTEKIKSLTLDETGKVATVEIYGNLVSKGQYQFTYGELKALFNAANTDIKEVAGLVFDDFQVKTDGTAPVNLLTKVKAVNKDGVAIIYGTDTNLSPYLTFEYKGEIGNGWVSGTDAYINKDGYSAKFKVTYNNHIYNEETKKYDQVKYEAEAIGVGVKTILENTTLQYAVAKSQPRLTDNDKWATSGFSIPKGDGSYLIFARYKNNTDRANDQYKLANSGANMTLRFVTTNSDLLVINGNSMYAAGEGVVTVLVKDTDDNVVGAFDVTIVGARAYVSAEANNQLVQLGNHVFDGADTGHHESRRITITNKDSVGDAVLPTVGTPVLVSGPTGTRPVVTTSVVTSGSNYGKVYVDITAQGAAKGSYHYKVELTALGTTKEVNFYVTVVEGQLEKNTLADVVNWKLELSDTEIDLKEQEGRKVITANVYGYNVNDARIYRLDPAQYELEILKGNTTTSIKTLVTAPTSTSIPVADIVRANNVTGTVDVATFVSGSVLGYPVASFATGASLGFVDLDTYVVYAKTKTANNDTGRQAGIRFASNTFTVKDSTVAKPELLKTTLSATTYSTVDAAVKEAFDFILNGEEITKSTARFSYKVTKGGNPVFTDGSMSLYNGDNLRVEEVYYTTTFDGGVSYVTYTFKVYASITMTR